MLEHPPITHKNMYHTLFVFYFLNTISSCWLPSGALQVLENPLVCVLASLSAILLPFPLHSDFFLNHLRLLLHVAPLGMNSVTEYIQVSVVDLSTDLDLQCWDHSTLALIT